MSRYNRVRSAEPSLECIRQSAYSSGSARLPRLGFCEILDRTHCQGPVLNRLDKNIKGLDLKEFHRRIADDCESGAPSSCSGDNARSRLRSLKSALQTILEKVPSMRTMLKAIVTEFDTICDLLEREAVGVSEDVVTAAMTDMSAELKAARENNTHLQLLWSQVNSTLERSEKENARLKESNHSLDTKFEEMTQMLLQCQQTLTHSDGKGYTRNSMPLVSLDTPSPEHDANTVSTIAKGIRTEIDDLHQRNHSQRLLIEQLRSDDFGKAEQTEELEEKLAAVYESLKEEEARGKAMKKRVISLEHELDKQKVSSPFLQIQSLRDQAATLIGDMQHMHCYTIHHRILQLNFIKGKKPLDTTLLCGEPSALAWPVRVEKCRKKEKFITFGDRLDSGISVPCFLRGKAVQSTRVRQLTHQEVKQFVKDFFSLRSTFEGFQNHTVLSTGKVVAMDAYLEKYLHAKFNIREQMMEWSYSLYSYAARNVLEDFDFILFTRITERSLPYCFWEHANSIVDSIKQALTQLRGVSLPAKDVLSILEEKFPCKTQERHQQLSLAITLDSTEGLSNSLSPTLSVERDALLSEKSHFMQELKRQIVFEHDDMFQYIKRTLQNMTARKSDQEHILYTVFIEYIQQYIPGEALEIVKAVLRTTMEGARKKRLQVLASASTTLSNMGGGGEKSALSGAISAFSGKKVDKDKQTAVHRGWFSDRAVDNKDVILSLPLIQYTRCLAACVPFVPMAGVKLDLISLASFE